MEKRRCVKTDEITVNMLVHALRDVFREEKEAGASTKAVSYTHLTLPTT